MIKKVVYGKEAKDKLLNGIHTVADAVTATMGVGGRNTVYKKYGQIYSTKDGVTVAKEISDLEDPIEDYGASMLKEAAIKTADIAGDGTTTATLLTQYISHQAIDAIENGANAVEVKKGIELGKEYVFKELEKYITLINTKEDLAKVATLSANGDKNIGDIIAEAIVEVGADGIVTIEKSKYGDTRLEYVDGAQFRKGFLSPYFATDDKFSKAVLENDESGEVKILIYDKVIGSKEQIIPVLEYVYNTRCALLIVAEDIKDEALNIALANKAKNGLKICPVKAYQFGDKRKEFLEDLAIITGGKVISNEKGDRLSDFKEDLERIEEYLGTARRVEVKSNLTTIVDSKGNKEEINKRIQIINEKLLENISNYEKEYLSDRKGMLAGSVGIIHITGMTEMETNEKKDRAEDALFATYCAFSDGVISGGGIPLFLIASKQITFGDTFENKHQRLGFDILLDACKQPFIKILSNAGIVKENLYSVINHLFTKSDEGKEVYHPLKKEFLNAYESGIIDPVKVTKTALHMAVSVSGTLMLTESVIYEQREENPQQSNFNQEMY